MPFFLDIETISTKSSAVILSAGIVYADASLETTTYQDVIENSIFVKFDVKDQVERLGRHVEKRTVDWWMKQAPGVRDMAMKPSPKDLKAEIGISVLSTWINQTRRGKDELCWIRGFMDSTTLEDLTSQLDLPSLFPYNSYRDVRTAIDLMYPNSKSGYVDVDPTRCIGFDISNVIKHHPVHDSAYDAVMIIYGKQ